MEFQVPNIFVTEYSSKNGASCPYKVISAHGEELRYETDRGIVKTDVTYQEFVMLIERFFPNLQYDTYEYYTRYDHFSEIRAGYMVGGIFVPTYKFQFMQLEDENPDAPFRRFHLNGDLIVYKLTDAGKTEEFQDMVELEKYWDDENKCIGVKRPSFMTNLN